MGELNPALFLTQLKLLHCPKQATIGGH